MSRIAGGTLPLLFLLMLLVPEVHALDREEFGRVLATIPPNGAYWEYGNVTMPHRSRKAGKAPVIFPHWAHRRYYTCRVCHLELGISMRQWETGITMRRNWKGEFCGACHDGTVAFSVAPGPKQECHRCHLPNPELLKDKFDAINGLPPASFGNGIDWAAALREGAITPINSFDGTPPDLHVPEKLSKPLKLGTNSPRSDVLFSHADHFAELDCSSCHPDLFNIKRKSTVSFTMESNIYGSFCGACHMQVAFPMNDCRRCHKKMSNH
ncbi:hypothetical protein L4X63_10140 [Geomonas sp. Red32]|uniref:c(7)-type cytochrome triheme domain-containing protein n=1 Tax=Geomonas sp. Red32 TaxID=2912856 RepID=UPI00202CB9E8|nr:hypothetical protein [Geomonas sp. Red32]